MARIADALRLTTLWAIRSEMRTRGIDPTKATLDDAWAILDDISRKDPKLRASSWYRCASKNQRRLFGIDWRRWLRESRTKSQ